MKCWSDSVLYVGGRLNTPSRERLFEAYKSRPDCAEIYLQTQQLWVYLYLHTYSFLLVFISWKF